MKVKYNFNLTRIRRNVLPPMSQQKLADVIGVHRNTIKNYELGISYPTPENQRKISTVLNAPAHEIFPIN